MKQKYGYKHFWLPDFMTAGIYDLTPNVFSSNGVKCVIFDIDNTVAPYEVPDADERMIDYFKSLTEHGIKVCFLSNNQKERVERFNKPFGFFYIYDAKKPSPSAVLRCMEKIGCKPEETLFVGDQIFTDCLAAHRAKIRCFLVNPIQPKETFFFKLKRALEKPLVCIYRLKNR